MVTGCVNVLVS